MRALRAYTKMEKYLAALSAGVVRIGLDGNPSGDVLEAEAAGTQCTLGARIAKHDSAPERQSARAQVCACGR
ncbi:hypothetical protein GHK68_00115 [Sinorhizobium meliloti]|nr:hypothetical protein [Sinorhizobium meliloti]